MPLSQFERVESNVRRLAQTFPDLPVTEALLARGITILARDISTLLENELKPYSLSETEFRLLMALFSHGGQAFAGDTCAALAQSPANLTRIADVLVERGLITRSPDLTDRRRMLLALQPEGERVVLALMPRIGPPMAAAFAGFSSSEKEQLLENLKRVLGSIDQVAANEVARGELA